MSGWLGKTGKPGHSPWPGAGQAGRAPQGPRGAAWRALLFVLLAVLAAWLMSGLFVLQSGQRAAIFRLGQFQRMTARVGLNWALPYPIESHEILKLAETDSVAIGDAASVPHSGLRAEQMLTADGSIVEVRLLAQYRIRDVKQYLLHQAEGAETLLKLAGAHAVRTALGGMSLTELTTGGVQAIASRVQPMLQAALDAGQSGIEITGLSAVGEAIRLPQTVQAAQQQVQQAREQQAQAAAQAASAASQALAATAQEVARLQDEAQAYKRQVVADARAESEQFAAVLPEYQKAPQATRSRLYHAAMQEVYAQMNKVVVDSQSGQPIHIALSQSGQAASASSADAASSPASAAVAGASDKANAAAGRSAADRSAAAPRGAASASQAANNPANNPQRSRDPALLRQRR
ncbi:MAG: FtsH protease activity modulator HflK [Brachymonas sp.]|nr:FtsH protease activity modulator HflK [Brachymonas sp.]